MGHQERRGLMSWRTASRQRGVIGVGCRWQASCADRAGTSVCVAGGGLRAIWLGRAAGVGGAAQKKVGDRHAGGDRWRLRRSPIQSTHTACRRSFDEITTIQDGVHLHHRVLSSSLPGVRLPEVQSLEQGFRNSAELKIFAPCGARARGWWNNRASRGLAHAN